MVILSFCLAVTSPSEDLELQASGASGSDTSSDDVGRRSQEVLWYEIRRRAVSEVKRGSKCIDVVWQPRSGPGSAHAASCPVDDLSAQNIILASNQWVCGNEILL